MSNIHQLKHRIKTTDNISQITKAMEMVAASKMRKSQEQALTSRAYSQALYELLTTLVTKAKLESHPLLTKNKQGLNVALLITADKGLCGPLNTHLFKLMTGWSKKQKNPAVVAIGKKGVRFAQRYDFKLIAQFTDLPDHLTSKDLLPITSLLLNKYQQQEFASVDLIFTDFINTLKQKPTQAPFLPLQQPKFKIEPSYQLGEAQYLFEPTTADILQHLLTYTLENTVFQALLEAKASEHSARMVAMKNASENANELMDALKLVFNKTRQANITNELLDMTTATLTLSQSGASI